MKLIDLQVLNVSASYRLFCFWKSHAIEILLCLYSAIDARSV